MSRSYHIGLISLILMTSLLGGCRFKEFKEARALKMERQAERKAAYKAQKEAEEQAALVAEEEAKAKAEAQEMAPVPPIQIQAQDSLFLHYERTACFGRCPIFKIKVYKSGYTTYEGVNFVENMGYYYHRVDERTMSELYAAIADADYFSLEDRYDRDNVMDLPSKVFEVNAMGRNKRIVARMDVPQQLLDFADTIEDIFKEVPWQAVPVE